VKPSKPTNSPSPPNNESQQDSGNKSRQRRRRRRHHHHPHCTLANPPPITRAARTVVTRAARDDNDDNGVVTTAPLQHPIHRPDPAHASAMSHLHLPPSPPHFLFTFYVILNVYMYIIIKYYLTTINSCKPVGYPPRVRVRVYPGSENGYPPGYPYPHCRVWVSTGTGMGTGKSTHGLPAMFTNYKRPQTECTLTSPTTCHSHASNPHIPQVAV